MATADIGLTRYAPEDLARALAKYLNSSRDLLASEHRQYRENWSALRLGWALENSGSPCAVWVEWGNSQRSFDFQLETGVHVLSFQTTEVMRPGRRRHADYKAAGAGNARKVLEQEPDVPTEAAIDAMRQGIEKKAGRLSTAGLALLVYVNLFGSRPTDLTSLRSALAAGLKPWHSVWLDTGRALVCLKPCPELGDPGRPLPIGNVTRLP